MEIIPALYIDPSAGSLTFQIAIGGALSAAAAARLYWTRLRRGIDRLFSPSRAR